MYIYIYTYIPTIVDELPNVTDAWARIVPTKTLEAPIVALVPKKLKTNEK
jgi:hypothetical protein